MSQCPATAQRIGEPGTLPAGLGNQRKDAGEVNFEEVLNQHPSVKDSAVIGLPDESRGEVPLAFVELNQGATFDEPALRAHCRAKLAGYKVPKEIRHIEALPRNATGKIVRRALKA